MITDRTLIIIPAFNEEEALPGVLKELGAVVPEHDVLVVDDGSTDGTWLAASSMGTPVARLPFNLGVGSALRTGFRYAAEHGYDRAVQVDADGQHDPTQIGLLLARLDGGADMVIGSRFSGTGEYEVGKMRLRAMKLLRLVMLVLAGRHFSDVTSGFRAFGRDAVDLFAAEYPAEYLGDTVESLLIACYSGLKVAEASTEMRQRTGGHPSNRNLKLMYHYIRVMIILFSAASLRGRRSTRRA